MRNFPASSAFVILLAALSACSNNAAPDAAASKSDATSGEPGKPARLPDTQKQYLAIETVSTAQETELLSLPGRITFRPQANSAVGATVTGRVAAQLVRAGEIVKAGAPLLVIESADAAGMRAALDQAATRLTAAEQFHRRQAEMLEKGVGLESEKQEAEARLKDARAEHQRAQHAVAMIGAGNGNRITVRAPTNGVVVSIRVAVGTTVAPGGEPLLELGDPTLLQAVAQVPESDLKRIATGQQADIEIPALAVRLGARVESISPRVDTDSRRAQIYLNLDKRSDGLQAGMLAQIALRVGNDAEITVPASAVLIRNGTRRVVYVENRDGAFETRDVRTGRNRGGKVVILDGLSTGERIVVRGALLLDTQAELLL